MSNLPDYSEVERLRLQLHHAELQRDAFKAMAEARLDVLIRDVLSKQKPVTDWAALGSTYYYDPKEAAPLRQDDKVTTYEVDGKQVTKEQYDIACIRRDMSELLDAHNRLAESIKKPAKRKRRG
jgi:hypothetical protein